jgi:uncharacterized protein DUF6999
MSAEDDLWAAVGVAPGLPFDPAARRLLVLDQRRWSRRWLYPWVRPLSRLVVTLIVVAKRVLPIRGTAHSTMDTMCVWFLRRFVSPGAGQLLVRHFIVETNLLAFIARNAPTPGVPEVTLRPTSLRQLGDRAVIEHDVNVYDVLIALGAAIGCHPLPRVEDPDTTMLAVPAIDAEPGTRRLMRLDIQTALCLMNIPFALCLSPAEYRRAVHSLRLDSFVLGVLAELTGDPTFNAWAPSGTPLRVDTRLDVPTAVYEHAVSCEYAHALLLRRSARRYRPGALVGDDAPVGQRHDPVGRRDDRLVVAGDEHQMARVRELAQDAEHQVDAATVLVAGGFVGEQDVRA